MGVGNGFLLKAFTDFSDNSGLDRGVVLKILKNSFDEMIINRFGSIDGFEVILDVDHDYIQVFREKLVVKSNSEVKNDVDEISLSNARKIYPDSLVGESIVVDFDLKNFSEKDLFYFKEVFTAHLKDAKKNKLYLEYSGLLGTIISVEVVRVCNRYIVVNDTNGNEFYIKAHNQIPGEHYSKNKMIKVLVSEVKKCGDDIVVILNRSSDMFLEKLLESEVPEIKEGTILIRKVARIPGDRSKIVVESIDEHIDPVGTCVGIQCSRIGTIWNELKCESVQVVQYSDDLSTFISRVLGTNIVREVKVIDDENIFIYVNKDQFGLSVGKNGSNVKLLKMLLNRSVDIFAYDSESERCETVELLKDELDPWIIRGLKNNGYCYLKDILSTPKDVLEKKTDFEKKTIDRICELAKENVKCGEDGKYFTC